MKIVHLNTSSTGGGASSIAKSLRDLAIKDGYDSILLSKSKNPLDSNSYALHSPNKLNILKNRLFSRLHREYGTEYQPRSESERLLKHLDGKTVLHFHNISGNFFDIAYIAELSKKYLTIITMHDSWYYTGHCSHHFECANWKNNCLPNCNQLATPPEIYRDKAYINQLYKLASLKKSNVIITSPAKWLIDEMNTINDFSHLKKLTIPNGINTEIFNGFPRVLKSESITFCCAGSHLNSNFFKNYQLTVATVLEFSKRHLDKKIELICIGATKSNVEMANLNIIGTGSLSQKEVSDTLKKSDVFIHLSNGDTFPTVLLEATCSGLPMIGSNIGGIPEIIINDETGYVVPNILEEILYKIELILSSKNIYENFSKNALKESLKFNQNRMYYDYKALYEY